MSNGERIEHRNSVATPRNAQRDADWYTLASWPSLHDGGYRLMLALHRTTGECHIYWDEIERAPGDVSDQARHLARALLAIRLQALAQQSAERAE